MKETKEMPTAILYYYMFLLINANPRSSFNNFHIKGLVHDCKLNVISLKQRNGSESTYTTIIQRLTHLLSLILKRSIKLINLFCFLTYSIQCFAAL